MCHWFRADILETRGCEGVSAVEELHRDGDAGAGLARLGCRGEVTVFSRWAFGKHLSRPDEVTLVMLLLRLTVSGAVLLVLSGFKACHICPTSSRNSSLPTVLRCRMLCNFCRND